MSLKENFKKLDVGTPRKMKDGTTAYLSQSKNYFIRREPTVEKWKYIRYYTLEGDYIQLAKGRWKLCEDTIESKHCGDYVGCSCGASRVDTDRWFPERHRYLGENIEVCTD